MRTLTNEEALDLFADLLEPIAEILTDEEVKAAYAEKPIKGIKKAIKRHKRTIVSALALIDGVPVKEYKVDVLTLPFRVLELANRPEFQDLFQSQGQTRAAHVSGSATGTTGGGVN